jgi:hypothetical protein
MAPGALPNMNPARALLGQLADDAALLFVTQRDGVTAVLADEF